MALRERVLDKENWKLEAQAVIDDIKDHVKFVSLSDKLVSSNSYIFINVTTLEERQFCVELSAKGFRICGLGHDQREETAQEYFETPYGLLNKISELYSQSFGKSLMDKLNALVHE